MDQITPPQQQELVPTTLTDEELERVGGGLGIDGTHN